MAILCQAAGPTTAGYSFGYVAHWAAGDPQAVKATAETVISTAPSLLHRIGLLEPQPAPTSVPVAA